MKSKEKIGIARKSKKFYIVTYLMARLSSTIEISKLLAGRFRPKPQSVEIERQDRALDHGRWGFTEEGSYFISASPEKIVVHEMPKRIYN